MCLLSMGILYFLQHHAESLAEAWYILLVNHSGLIGAKEDGWRVACAEPPLVSSQASCSLLKATLWR